MSHTAQLALFPGLPVGRRRTSGRNAGNRARHDASARRQLARCDQALARLRVAEMPRFRRCEVCDGLEDTTQPHPHATA